MKKLVHEQERIDDRVLNRRACRGNTFSRSAHQMSNTVTTTTTTTKRRRSETGEAQKNSWVWDNFVDWLFLAKEAQE